MMYMNTIMFFSIIHCCQIKVLVIYVSILECIIHTFEHQTGSISLLIG